MYVSHGVVHLVEIVLVVIRTGHAPEFLQHTLCSPFLCGHDLGLHDAGVEGQVEGRTLPEAAAKGAVGTVGVAEAVFHLSEEEIESCLSVAAAGVAGGAFEVRDGLFVALLTQEEVGGGGVGELPQAVGHAVAAKAGEGILGVVEPSLLRVASCQPLACLGGHVGFGGIEARDVGEGGCGLEKFAFLKLRLAHEEPGVFEEGVVLLALEIGSGLGGASCGGFELGLLLYGVERDGFLAFGDGRFVIGLARLSRLLVSHEEHGELLGVVVLVCIELGFFSVDECLLPVVEGVVACGEGMPPACARRVFAGGAGGREQQQAYEGREGQYGNSTFDEKKIFLSNLFGAAVARGAAQALSLVFLKLRYRLFIAFAGR